MMRKLTIAVDCDDTLFPTAKYFIDSYNKKFNASVDLEHQHEPDYDGWGVGDAELLRRLGMLQGAEEYRQIEMYDDAVRALNNLRAEGHRLVVVTARKEHERPITELMIERDAPGVFDTIEFVGWHGSKHETLRKIGADVLVDDSMHHLNKALEEGILDPGCALLFGDFPWSRAIVEVGESIVRCADWIEVEQRIERVANS